MENSNEIGFAAEAEISWHCIKPIILRIRGKSMDIKYEEFKKLNKGQRAIFSFHVYYNHAKNDIDSFIYWSRLYLENHFFAQIKNGAHYFSSTTFVCILAEVEETLGHSDGADIQKLYETFKTVGEEHKLRMGKIIAANKDYFYSYG